MRIRAALLVVAALAAGCASGLPTPEARRTAEKIEELEARVIQLQRQAAVNEVELARLRQQVADLEAQTGRQGAVRREAASPSRPPPAPAPPPEAEGLEETDLEIWPADEPAPGPVSTPPSPAPPAGAAAGLPPGPPPAAGSPEAAAPLPPVTREGQLLYDRGYTLYHQGRYVEAETRFQEFLEQFPATELSDNAQYWIGASRQARGDDLGALAAFRLTVERYPRGNKVPDALFKIGECLESLEDSAGAVEIYRELARRFSHTAAAALAEERLELLANDR